MTMLGVNTRHVEWNRKFWTWKKARDAVEGQDCIKLQGQTYLPIPSGFINNDKAASAMRNYAFKEGDSFLTHQTTSNYNPNFPTENPAYNSYLQRASFPEYAANTVRGLVGLAMRKPPVVTVPLAMEELLGDAITKDGMTLIELYKKALEEVITVGRYSLLVDVNPSTNTPLLVTYKTESFINWKTIFRDQNRKLRLAVFEEEMEDPKDNVGLFGSDPVLVWRVLVIDETTNTYVSKLMTSDNELLDFSEPSLMGQTLSTIPLITIGSAELDHVPDNVPIAGVVNLALQSYMISADLRQSEFLTANPTFVVSGVDAEEAPDAVGSTVMVVLPNDSAKAYYTQTDSTALQHYLTHLDRIEESALLQGASLVGPSKGGVESGEALRLRQSSQGATLVEIVQTVAKGIERTLKTMANWMGLSDNEIDEITFEPNIDFSDHVLTAQELQALVSSWMQGAISYDTLFRNLQESGIANDATTSDEEMATIENEGPTPALKGMMSRTLTSNITPTVANMSNTAPQEDNNDDNEDNN